MGNEGSLKKLGPARVVAAGFLVLIFSGALLLTLPVMTASGTSTSFKDALFTATSAVSLTGLITVDTGSHWNLLGQAVVVILIQLGGLGIMSMTSVAGWLLTGRVGLKSRMNAAAEGRSQSAGGVRRILGWTLALTFTAEAFVAVIITGRMMINYGMSFKHAIWEGIFHSVSAFNNAGFGLRSDSLVPYVGDAWIIIPIALSFMIGGLGFPVLSELVSRTLRKLRGNQVPSHLSVTCQMTLFGTTILVLAGWFMVLALEWSGVLSGRGFGEKLLASFFQGVTPRTAGFNSLDYGQMHPITLMGTDILMIIGGGSAGTAGGIKITTIVVLAAGMAAEFKGEKSAIVAKRRISSGVIRQAMTVAAAGVTFVVIAIGALRWMDPQFNGDQVTFEVVSAFATVGLSTGITAQLSTGSQLVLCAMMYLGRIGPITLVSSLAMRNIKRRFEYPVERPFIG